MELIEQLKENIVYQRKLFKDTPRFLRSVYSPKYYFYKKIVKTLFKSNFENEKIVKTNTFFGEDIFGYFWDSNFFHMYFFDNLSRNEFSLLLYFIKNISKEDIFFDIGANYGFYSLLATNILKERNIHLFEPNPAIFKAVQKTFCDKSIISNKLALAQENGVEDFYNKLQGFHSGGSSLFKKNISYQQYKKIKVKTESINSYCQKEDITPTFIKMDIEGGEYDALLGAEKILKNNKDITLAIELKDSEKHKNAIDLLLKIGFNFYGINREGKLERTNKNDFINFKSLNFVFKK